MRIVCEGNEEREVEFRLVKGPNKGNLRLEGRYAGDVWKIVAEFFPATRKGKVITYSRTLEKLDYSPFHTFD